MSMSKVHINHHDFDHEEEELADPVYKKSFVYDEDMALDMPLLSPEETAGIGDKQNNTKAKKKNSASLKRLVVSAKPEFCMLFIGTIALFLGTFINLLVPALAGVIVEMVVNPGGTIEDWPAFFPAPTLTTLIIMLACVFLLGSVFSFFRATLFTVAGERVVARMRKQLFAAIMRQEVGFFDITRTGELTNRLSADTQIMQNAVTVNVSMGLRYVAQAIGSVILLLYISWSMTIVMLISVPAVVVGAVAYGLFVRKLATKTQDALASASEVAEEAISNLRTVRTFSKEHFEMGKYDTRVDESYRLGKLKGIAYGGFSGIVMFMIEIAFGLVLWYGAFLVQDDVDSAGTVGRWLLEHDSLSAGGLTSFLLYTLTVAMALGGMSVLWGDFMKAVGASERVFELMDREPKVKYEGGIRPARIVGHIEFFNVRFSYPSRPETMVLKGINLTLQPGKVVAVVGPSGGGKTTLANLIEQFYYPSSGSITLDGEDIKHLDPKWLHEHIGIVSQGPCLFAATIRENIAYGLDDVPLHRIEEAAKIANAHEFITRFPEKYDAMVGERGVRLSGGQKQRIAISRAVLKDPKILLLDEATSDLDSESEHLVQEALDRLMKGRTVLVIAHRLSTVRNADQILVMKDGQIVEQGNHDELMQQDGIYVQLVSHQLQR